MDLKFRPNQIESGVVRADRFGEEGQKEQKIDNEKC